MESFILRLKEGDAAEEQKWWSDYFGRLVSLAQVRLGGTSSGKNDAEDIAISAMKSFYIGLKYEKFDDVHNRNSIWKLLVKIAIRKVAKEIGDRNRPGVVNFTFLKDKEIEPLKNEKDKTLYYVALWKREGYSNGAIAENLQSNSEAVLNKIRIIRKKIRKSPPYMDVDDLEVKEFAPEMESIAEDLLARLETIDTMFRPIVLGRQKGLANIDIAKELGCSRQTVQTKLREIRIISSCKF